MRYLVASLVLAVVAPGSGLSVASAQQSGGSGRTTTITCSNETTRVDGVGERVRLVGECRAVVVSGSGNRVLVERVGSLNVSGMNNEVRWERSLEGDAPRVVTSGIKNSVIRVTPTETRAPAPAAPEKPRSAPPASASGRTSKPPATGAAAPPPPPPAAAPTAGSASSGRTDPLVVRQSGQTLRLDCESRPVTVSGSTNTLTLTGACGQLSVSGSGNKIIIERTSRIVATGHNNDITWQQGEGERAPSVRTSGMNNTVRREGK
jgi:hypothetical protein